MSGLLRDLHELLIVHFPAEWATAALTLNLLTIWVVIGLFIYLNHSTRQERFGLWTAAWMFYSVYLAASIGLRESPDVLWLVMGRRACIGISALLMFWGSLELTRARRSHRELIGGIALILIWSYVAAYRIGNHWWITMPVFALLAAASVHTGVAYLRQRARYRAGWLLGSGFVLWGVHLVVFPLLDMNAPTMTAAHLVSAALALFIALGMLVEQEQLVSEQDYRTLFESASDAIVLVDGQRRTILEANRAALELTGCQAGTLIGQPVWAFLPALRDRAKDDWEAGHLAEQINRVREFVTARHDGTYVTWEVWAGVARCPRGRVLQINARDITREQRVADELRVKSVALEASDSCVLLSDREGRIIWVNPAFTVMTGFSLEDAVGERAWLLKNDPVDSALQRELFTVLQGDRPWSGEVVNRRKDDSTYRERLTIIPVRDTRGVLTNFITLKRDLDAGPASPA